MIYRSLVSASDIHPATAAETCEADSATPAKKDEVDFSKIEWDVTEEQGETMRGLFLRSCNVAVLGWMTMPLSFYLGTTNQPMALYGFLLFSWCMKGMYQWTERHWLLKYLHKQDSNVCRGLAGAAKVWHPTWTCYDKVTWLFNMLLMIIESIDPDLDAASVGNALHMKLTPSQQIQFNASWTSVGDPMRVNMHQNGMVSELLRQLHLLDSDGSVDINPFHVVAKIGLAESMLAALCFITLAQVGHFLRLLCVLRGRCSYSVVDRHFMQYGRFSMQLGSVVVLSSIFDPPFKRAKVNRLVGLGAPFMKVAEPALMGWLQISLLMVVINTSPLMRTLVLVQSIVSTLVSMAKLIYEFPSADPDRDNYSAHGVHSGRVYYSTHGFAIFCNVVLTTCFAALVVRTAGVWVCPMWTNDSAARVFQISQLRCLTH